MDSLPSAHFSYRASSLYCEEVALCDLASQYGTPLYVYSRQTIEEAAQKYETAFCNIAHKLCYAVKANSNLAILKILQKRGWGFDIVSLGELARVLQIGADPKKIVFSGVGKTEEEIRVALSAGVGVFNIESEPEFERLAQIATEMHCRPRVYFRVNPDVDAHTHPYISTGLKTNKFGVDFYSAFGLLKRAAVCESVELAGIDCHIGSQLTSFEPYFDACDRLLDLLKKLRAAGIELKDIDFGGGVGVCYRDETVEPIENLVLGLKSRLTQSGFDHLRIVMEPGRSIVAAAGLLLCSVQYVKTTPVKHFLITDAGMNDLIRPALYAAWMPVLPIRRSDCPEVLFDVVGPVCESSDWLARDRVLPAQAGELLAVTMAGAYGMSMASRYNSRRLPAEVLVSGKTSLLIRRRDSLEDLWTNEIVPADI